jgi:peptidoglycan-associated lipoprotein
MRETLLLPCFLLGWKKNDNKSCSSKEQRMKQSKKMSVMAAMIASAFVLSACGGSTSNGVSSSTSPSYSSSSTSSQYGGSSTGSYLTENIGDRVFFETDQSSLNSSSRGALRAQAEWLAQNANISLTIEGHADERGTRDYNLALGARRANAVRDFLISQGVDSARLQTISYGKERPVSLCSDDSCWSKNRRAVSVIR